MAEGESRNEFCRAGALPAAVLDFSPEVGLVLGSGLGSFVDGVDVAHVIPCERIDGVPGSGVEGHAGKMVLGRVGDRRLLIAQGRVHLYEGYGAKEVTAGVRLMAAAGVKLVVLTNAAGSVNADFAPGRWMQIVDHINLTGTTPLLGSSGRAAAGNASEDGNIVVRPEFVDMTKTYAVRWRSHFRAVADSLSTPLYEGVYAGMLGPQYETPAEVNMLGRMGVDAVGMSTVLEAIEARALGMEVAGFSCLTNWAAGLAGSELSHAEVMETAKRAAGQLAAVLENALPLVPVAQE